MSITTSGDPRVVLYGVDDQSVPPLVFVPARMQITTPLSMDFASEGPENMAYRVIGDNAKEMYGRDVFDLDRPSATSATKYIKLFNELSNSQIFHRLVPDDATLATLRFYVEFLETDVPVYKRLPNGDLEYGPDNQPQQNGTVKGISLTWRTAQISEDTGEFAAGKTYQGTQVSTDDDGTKSTIYPIFDFIASSRCRKNNDRGIRICCTNKKSQSPVDTSIVNNISARTIDIQLMDILVPGTSPSIIKTLDGANTLTVSAKPGAYYRPAKMGLDIEAQLIRSYRDMNPAAGMPMILSPFEKFHVYRENLELVLGKLKTLLNSRPGGELGIEDPYMIDAFTGMDLDGHPYNAVVVDTGKEGGVVLSEKHTHYMTGGTDGTTTQENFDKLVQKEMLQFGDGPVPYLDVLKYPFKFMWDTGMTMDTKQAMTNFIGKRKDTILVLTTHVHGEPANTIQKENSMKIALNAMLAAHPESPKYGTATFRGFIVGHSYILNDAQDIVRTPCSYSLAKFTARYGAGEEGFKSEYRFDRGELAVIHEGYDINLTYKPQETYASDFEKGCINIRSFNEHEYTFPALYSVYPEQRSVLNGYIPAIVLADLEFLATQTWSEMSGSQSLTDAEIKKMMKEKLENKVRGNYDNVMDIEVFPFFTAEDKANGNTISCEIHARGNVLKGIHKYTVVALRRNSEVN